MIATERRTARGRGPDHGRRTRQPGELPRFVAVGPWALGYGALGLAVAASFVWHVMRQTWGSDFWGHLAIVRELATHPLHPRHPQLLADYPHAFYSPYTLVLGLLSRLSGLEPIYVLELGAVLNLLLFLLSFRLFCFLVAPAPAVPLYALLFTLFLWGPSAWDSAGFFNFRSIGEVLPYPSTFATAVTLLILVASARWLQAPPGPFLVAFPISVSLVLLTHPLTALFLFIGLGAIAIHRYSPALRPTYLIFAALLLLGFLLAAAWPYYPFLDLISSRSPQYDDDQSEMYQQVLERVYPALLGLPFLLARLKSNRRDVLGLIFLTTSVLYVYGGLSGSWRYGRMISYMVLSLHLALADGIVRMVVRPPLARAGPLVKKLGLAGILAICVLSGIDSMGHLQRIMAGPENLYDDYQFLRQYTGQYDVLLSDLNTSNFVPALGGKVVAPIRFLSFVPDLEQRRADVREFFEKDAAQVRREEILRTYGVDWVLVDREAIMGTGASLSSLRRLGRVAYEDRSRGLVLINVSS